MLIYSTWIISISLIFLFGYAWINLLASLSKILVNCFGHRCLYLGGTSVEIERKLFIFRDKCRNICQISDIQNVQAIPSEGVIIQIGTHRYVFGQKLTAHEAEWLVGEIHEWLNQSKNEKGEHISFVRSAYVGWIEP